MTFVMADFIVAAAVVIAVILGIRTIFISKRNGNCSGCPYCDGNDGSCAKCPGKTS